MMGVTASRMAVWVEIMKMTPLAAEVDYFDPYGKYTRIHEIMKVVPMQKST